MFEASSCEICPKIHEFSSLVPSGNSECFGVAHDQEKLVLHNV